MGELGSTAYGAYEGGYVTFNEESGLSKFEVVQDYKATHCNLLSEISEINLLNSPFFISHSQILTTVQPFCISVLLISSSLCLFLLILFCQ